MIKVGDKYLRNLEEQVQYLTNYHDVNQGLVQWGIRVVGQVETEDELPLPYDGEYGDAIAVGTEAPFFFYIWTRAAIAGESPYWFPFGEISIVGPEGPRGEQGPVGPQGESSKWISANIAPHSADQYNLNDQWLNTSNGNVYELRLNPANGEKYWQNIGNIMGPQGVRGPQGIQGTPGPRGEKGEQGERGDVGGFINIWGILTNQSQLPTPASINNLTVAYLIGATMPYDLWVQVGENSTTAIWENTGPFNAATAVSVNGVYQNVWDADTKIDKNTASSNGIYGKSAGNEYFYSISQGTTGDTIARRTNYGGVKCVTKNADDATTKKYVDDGFVAKPSGAGAIYAAGDGTFSVRTIAGGEARPWSIVERTTNGVIYTGTPTADGHATTKAYVDSLSVIPYILNFSGDVSVSVIIPTAIHDYQEIPKRVYHAGYTSLENIYPIHGIATDNNIIVGMYSTDGQTLKVVTSEDSELECESGYPLARL